MSLLQLHVPDKGGEGETQGEGGTTWTEKHEENMMKGKCTQKKTKNSENVREPEALCAHTDTDTHTHFMGQEEVLIKKPLEG